MARSVREGRRERQRTAQVRAVAGILEATYNRSMAPELGVEARVRWRQGFEEPLMAVLMFTVVLLMVTRAPTWAVGLIDAFLIVAVWRKWRGLQGTLHATGRGITVNGRQLAPWGRVRGVVRAGQQHLFIRYRWLAWPRTVLYEVEDATSALCVEELAASRVGRLEISACDPRAVRLLWLGSGAFMVCVVMTGHMWWLAAAVLLGVVPSRRPVAVIGADGVFLRGWLRCRFARADRIIACRVVGAKGLRIELTGERPMNLRLLDVVHFRRAGNAVVDGYLWQVRALILGARRPAPDLSEAQRGLLRRGERPLGEWAAALRDSARSAHRDALPRELLWQVAEAPGSDEERAAALAALAPSFEPSERARVEEIRRELSSPRVRVAVDAALAGDARKVEHALGVASARPR
jgi:hypothetical protein